VVADVAAESKQDATAIPAREKNNAADASDSDALLPNIFLFLSRALAIVKLGTGQVCCAIRCQILI